MAASAASLTQQILSLDPEHVEQIEALILALRTHEHQKAFRSLSEPALEALWNDPENDVYDAL